MAAGGLLPPIAGVQTDGRRQRRSRQAGPRQGVGAGVATDPTASLWARVACPDAGPKHGFCFLPEVGDEVWWPSWIAIPAIGGAGRLHGSKNPAGCSLTRNRR
jgi:hypothetical protein